ncbi:transmembrane protein 272-like [Glandiceps talaboti]
MFLKVKWHPYSKRALYKDDCPFNPNIPIYLIVCGVFQSVAIILSMCCIISSSDDGMLGNDCCRCVAILIYLSIVAWLFAGNWLIYRTKPDYDDPTGKNYCDKTLYLFSLWWTTLSNILIALVCCCRCVACLVNKISG